MEKTERKKRSTIYKILSLILVVSFLVSFLNFLTYDIFYDDEDFSGPGERIENNVEFVISELGGGTEQPKDESPNCKSINNEVPVSTISNQGPDTKAKMDGFYTQAGHLTIDHQNTRARMNDEKYEYDLSVNRTISVNFPGHFIWYVQQGKYLIPHLIAGEIGKETTFSINIENIGKNSSDQALLVVNLTDTFGQSSWEQRDYLGTLKPGDNYNLNFTWVPTYSNRYNLTCNLIYSGDQNQSNNVVTFWNLFTKKWADNFSDGDISDWSGDIGSDSWHLTETIQDDPNPNAHTSPYVLYHGNEETGEPDEYGEKNDLEIITPDIDLRRFNKNSASYLNFRFYGESTKDKDKFSIEGYKSSEQEWLPISLAFDSGKTIDQNNDSSWNLWITGSYIGIPINAFNGELTKFKIHWQSDLIPDQYTGFYFDDFFVYGFENPPPEYDIGIEKIWYEPGNRNIMVGEEFKIKANITNYGTILLTELTPKIEIRDLAGQDAYEIHTDSGMIEQILPGKSKIITYNIIPQVAGIYFINLSINHPLDVNKDNNRIEDFGVQIDKFFDSNDADFIVWQHDIGWVQKQVANNPDGNDESVSMAWYISRSKIDPNWQMIENLTIALYTPTIDLDGAFENPLFQSDQIGVNFNWLGTQGSNDAVNFEYSLDNSGNWELFPPDNTDTGTLINDKPDTWQSWVWELEDKYNLFGHHIQFRWCFEPSIESDDNSGFYIDDFSLWIVQEEAGRPEIFNIEASSEKIINDGRDQIEVMCEIRNQSSSSTIEQVYIDLSEVHGPEELEMDYYSSESNGLFGYYQIFKHSNITVPATVSTGNYVLKITVVDNNGRTDNNYLQIQVKENTEPKIVNFFPTKFELVMNESESQIFSVEAFDLEDGNNLHYNWYLNNIPIADMDRNRYKFITEYHGNFSAGNYEIKVIISDNGLPNKTVQLEWSMEVLDVLPDFELRRNDLELISHDNLNITINQTLEFTILVHNLQPPPEQNVTVHLIQQSTNSSIPDSVYKKYYIDRIRGRSIEFLTLSWRANASYRYLKIWVDPDDVFPEVLEDNNYITIPVNVSLPPVTQKNDSISDLSSDDGGSIPLIIPIVAGLICIILSLSIAVGTEFGNYQLYLLFAPFYSRVKGNKILEHQLRSKIYMYIRAHPGDHYRSIMTKLKIKNGTLVHHLARLEQEELIKSERDGYYKRFYPIGLRIPKSEVGMYYPEGMATYNIGEHQVSAIQLRIIKTIKKNPGLTQKEIALKIKESRRVVNYHIKLLEQHELVRVERKGRETQCYIVDRYSVSS
jgi:predicted transcriptional regulator